MDIKTKPPLKNFNATTNMKRSSSSNSDSHTRFDSPHSPLRLDSPFRSDQGDPDPPDDSSPYASPLASPQKSPNNLDEKPDSNSKAIVALTAEKYTQGSRLPEKTAEAAPPALNMHKAMREDGAPPVTSIPPGGWRSETVTEIVMRSRAGERLKVANLGFRLTEVVLCLISFSVMAADKTQGWSGDSFDRYKEYRVGTSPTIRDLNQLGFLLWDLIAVLVPAAVFAAPCIDNKYCLSVNVIAFVYSGFQSYDLAHYQMTGKHLIRHHLMRAFDFFMDQILAYLLISAASAAATRVDDWQSNWGKDEFTEMAGASVAMSFLAFIAFAFSSAISGYYLCNRDST